MTAPLMCNTKSSVFSDQNHTHSMLSISALSLPTLHKKIWMMPFLQHWQATSKIKSGGYDIQLLLSSMTFLLAK
jgi:hypothetical protein